jgi:hypothetical protein
MKFEEDDIDNPKPGPMNALMEDLDKRYQVVVSLMREEGSDVDRDPTVEQGAFAFVLGHDSNNAIVVEGTTAGDDSMAMVTVWGMRDGERVQLSTLELGEQVMHSLLLD